MYLGRADKFASSIALVLNLDTGSITPQFHVVLDDWFHTVSAIPAELPDFNSPEWLNMFGDSSLQYLLDDSDVSSMRELSTEPENAIDTAGAVRARDRVLDALYRHPPASSPAQLSPSVPLSLLRYSLLSLGGRFLLLRQSIHHNKQALHLSLHRHHR
jgi:hypothetical protein